MSRLTEALKASGPDRGDLKSRYEVVTPSDADVKLPTWFPPRIHGPVESTWWILFYGGKPNLTDEALW